MRSMTGKLARKTGASASKNRDRAAFRKFNTVSRGAPPARRTRRAAHGPSFAQLMTLAKLFPSRAGGRAFYIPYNRLRSTL